MADPRLLDNVPTRVVHRFADAATGERVAVGSSDDMPTPPALPLPLCHVRRPADAWLDELPTEARRVLEAARQGRAGPWALRVAHVIGRPGRRPGSGHHC